MAQVRNNVTHEGRNAMVRSTKNNDIGPPPDDRSEESEEIDRPGDDRSEESEEIVEALMDDDEVVVDGFQRLSVLGLEVMTLDGPLRARAVKKLEGEGQGGQRPG